MKFPVLPIIMPTNLTGQKNGQVDKTLLRTIHTAEAGLLDSEAATAWNCLQVDAYFNKLALNQVGAYRNLATQTAMFNDRYSLTDGGRVPQVIRIYQGKKYYLKPGKSPSATPGNSDHGWGLAIDVANCGLNSPICKWLLGDGFATCKALEYGFTWAVSDPKNPNFEAWHLQYVCGDTFTASTKRMVEVFPNLLA